MEVIGNRFSKLFTSEDKFNLHKILGLYVSLHYCYRFGLWIFKKEEDVFVDTVATSLSIVPHMLLPLTSFFFEVAKNRLKVKPTIIWEEMRLHSILFTMRSFLIFILTRNNFGRFSFVPLLFCHVLADVVTKQFGKPNISTIRVDSVDSNNLVWALKMMYSWSQIGATYALLMDTPSPQKLLISFAVMVPIQYAAFLMTLSRKNIISKPMYHLWYVLAILYPLVIVTSEIGFFFLVTTSFLSYLRFWVGCNKYLLWICVSFLVALTQ